MYFWFLMMAWCTAAGFVYVSRGRQNKHSCRCLSLEPREQKKLLRILRKRRVKFVRVFLVVLTTFFSVLAAFYALSHFWNHQGVEITQVKEKSGVENFGEHQTCRHTVENPTIVVDENGRMCSPFALNSSNGNCCPRVPGLDVTRCGRCSSNRGQCCDTYESCVSCCIFNLTSAPGLVALAKDGGRDVTTPPFEGNLRGFWANRKIKGRSKHDFMTVRQQTDFDVDILKHRKCRSSDIFDTCTCRCRVDSLALHHENSYKDAYNYCFHDVLPPTLEPHYVIGRVGQSCDSACSTRGLRCDEHALFRINEHGYGVSGS